MGLFFKLSEPACYDGHFLTEHVAASLLMSETLFPIPCFKQANSLNLKKSRITDWHDRDISAGAEWASEIDSDLNAAQIILLLISTDFLASDYCYGVEMKRALERHEANDACVIPIIARPVSMRERPLASSRFFLPMAKRSQNGLSVTMRSSILRAYFISKKNPAAVFSCLHHSSLYWDEYIFLPLPLLRHTLLIAVGQDVQQALKEIAFIIDQRPQQTQAALATAIEVALRDMQRRETIRDIARASQRLSEILPQAVTLNDPSSMTPFTHLMEISLEAERYAGPLSWQTRRDALDAMLLTLEKIYPNSAFPDPQLNTLLADVIAKWHAAISYQQEKLEQGAESMGQVLNPYNPGNPLKPQDTLFVGRRDVVRQLSESLSKINRSTFLLNGERRMGKSSTLRQLPHLLGASYIPVLYDLQVRSTSASIDAFLTRIAEEIYKAVRLRGMNIERLEYSRLREALQRNEAAIYQPFDAWLDSVESRLQRENRTVFLLFDEFEKLEEANKAGYLDLSLLLDWFRNTMQNRSRIALLFSGVNTFGEIGENWAGYFVNARTFRVSFLRPEEARELITRPVPNFPSQQLFAEGVVEEIIHQTGCHPFLVQAVCSELIDNLNKDNRSQVEVQNVANAVTDVLENWWDTYFRDLWARTDQQQRTCLALLSQRGASDISMLAQHSGLDEQTVRQTLQVLLKRDLVLQDQRTYRIAAPMFNQWVERNS